MEYAAGQGMLVVIQPYDQALYANGCAHEGATLVDQCHNGLPQLLVNLFNEGLDEINRQAG